MLGSLAREQMESVVVLGWGCGAFVVVTAVVPVGEDWEVVVVVFAFDVDLEMALPQLSTKVTMCTTSVPNILQQR